MQSGVGYHKSVPPDFWYILTVSFCGTHGERTLTSGEDYDMNSPAVRPY